MSKVFVHVCVRMRAATDAALAARRSSVPARQRRGAKGGKAAKAGETSRLLFFLLPLPLPLRVSFRLRPTFTTVSHAVSQSSGRVAAPSASCITQRSQRAGQCPHDVP